MNKLVKMSKLSGLLGLFGFNGRGKGVKQQQRRTLSIQPLEERALLSVCHWTGNGANSLWSNSANWDTAPLSGRGDTLVFQGTQRTSTSNDLAAGSSFASIEFAANNFSLGGNSLILTSGVNVDSGVTGSAISLNTTLSGNVTFNLANSTSTLALSGVLSGSTSTFFETGSGTITLSGVGNSLLGFRVNGGTATFIGASSLSTGNTIANGGSINWNSSGNCYAGRLYVGWFSAGTFTQTAGVVGAGGASPGDLEMDVSGTYNLNGGILATSAINACNNGVVPSGNTVNMAGGTFQTYSQFTYPTISGLAWNMVSGTTSDITIVGSLTLSGVLSGTGNLIKAGDINSTLTLNAANPNFTGETYITSGALTLGNSLALEGSTLNLDSYGGGTLGFGSLTSATIGGLMGSRNLSLQNASSQGVELTCGNNNASTSYAGVLSGSNSTFVKVGTGTMTLTGVGSSLLSFRVYAGTATFANSSSLSTGNTIASGGTINWDSWGNCFAGRLYVGWGTAGTFTQTRGTVGAGGSTPGDIEMDTGGTYNLQDGGVLAVSAIDAYTNGVVPSGNTLNFSGGTLRITAPFTYSGMTYNLLYGGGTIDTQGYNLTLADPLSGSGDLMKTGSGTLTLSAASPSFTGNTRIANGTLTLANSSALQNSMIDLYSRDTGNLGFGSLTSATIGGLSGSRNLSLQNASSQGVELTCGGNNAYANYSGVLSGSNGSFFKVGEGSMTFLGEGSSLLSFRVYAGTVTFSGSSSLSTGNTIVNGGGEIDWNSTSSCLAGRLYVGWFSTGRFIQTAGTVGAGGSTPGDLEMDVAGRYELDGGVLATSAINAYNNGVVPNGNGMNLCGGTFRFTASFTCSGLSHGVYGGPCTIDTQGYNVTLADTLSGTGSLTKTGSGTLTLSGDNTCYSGTTTISNGVLKLGSATAVGRNSSVSIPNADNAYLDLNGQTIGSTVSLSAGNYTTGQSAIQNSSTTAATFAGPISLQGVGIYAGAGNGQITLSGNITDGGMNRYLCNGLATSTLVLSGSNNFGRLAVWGTRIRLNSGSALASTTQVDFRYNSTLEVNGCNITAGKFLSQSGSTETVLLNGGSLTVGDNSDQTFAGTISGTGSFVKQGTGMLTLSGTLNHTGQTSAAGGTLNLLAKPTSWVENGGAVIGPGALNFLDTATYQSVCSCFGDGVLDRNNMISILTTAESGNTVTQNELTDLRTIVSNPSRLRMTGYVSATNPGYVDVLASDVVNSNAANAHYQGATLGNLAANDSNTKLETLINKWFRGTDHPAVTDANYTYQQTTGSLFVNGPSVGDMDQSTVLGDCYLIGSLGAIAERSTDAIQNMFVDNNDNTWTVRFYAFGANTPTADYVTVDRMLPANSSALLVYANHGQGLSSELWMPLAEKAYAQWNETGNALRPTSPTNLNGYNTYAAIEAGNSGIATEQVLGVAATEYDTLTGAQSALNNALASGKAVTINTYGSGTTILTANHTYVVSSYNSGTGYYTLHNPHGPSYDPIPLTWSQLVQDCQWFDYDSASGTSPFNLPATHSSSSEVIDTLVNSGLATDSSLGPDVAQACHVNVLNTMKSSTSVTEPLVSVRAQSVASVVTCESGQSHVASVAPRSSMAKAIDEVMASGGIFDDEQLWKLH